MDGIETDTIDRLLLELSQVTKATTKRESELREQVNALAEKLGRARGMLHVAADTLNDCGAPIDADRIQQFLSEEG